MAAAVEAVEMSKKMPTRAPRSQSDRRQNLAFLIWTTANRLSWTAFAHASRSADTGTRLMSSFSGIVLNLACRLAR